MSYVSYMNYVNYMSYLDYVSYVSYMSYVNYMSYICRLFESYELCKYVMNHLKSFEKKYLNNTRKNQFLNVKISL